MTWNWTEQLIEAMAHYRTTGRKLARVRLHPDSYREFNNEIALFLDGRGFVELLGYDVQPDAAVERHEIAFDAEVPS